MKRKALALIVGAVFIFTQSVFSWGEILPNNSAPVSRRPQVIGGAVPIVNIAAPNSAGMSHNEYEKFDIGAQGAVLNNSKTAVYSHLTNGAIALNPNLSSEEASLILNEIVSANPSKIEGLIGGSWQDG